MNEVVFAIALSGFSVGMLFLFYTAYEFFKIEKETKKLRRIIDELQDEIMELHKMLFK